MDEKNEDFMRFFKHLREALGGKSAHDEDDDNKNERVIRSVPIKKEWKKTWNEIEEIVKELKNLQSLATHKRKVFWTTIEGELNHFGHLRYNKEKGTIEILEENED